ncbi:hypothetical protein ACQ4PT_071685 [Festuca glaucescens]
MAPFRRNPRFRHEPDDASRYGPVQSKPIIPTYAEDRSIAGITMEMSSRRQLEQAPICDRIDKPLLPVKKRATSDSSSSGLSSADGSFVIPSKKRRVESWSDGGSAAYEYDTVTVCAMAASLPAAAAEETHARRDTERRHAVRPARHGLAGMERAETSAAGAARAKKKTTNKNRDKVPPRVGVTFVPTRPLSLSEELSRRLAELGVVDTAPRFVCMKTLGKSDVDANQNRLLFSCKRDSIEGHPITAIVARSPRDRYLVHEHEPGLRVSAIDGRGLEFEVKLRYLYSNFAYRFIGEWGRFVTEHNLLDAFKKGRRVEVELWAFRSRRLLEDDDQRMVVEGLQDHPKGALGLIFLPYVDGRRAEELALPYVDDGHGAAEELAVPYVDDAHGTDEEETERAPPVHETKRHAPTKVVHGTKRQAPAKVVHGTKKLEDHVSANRGQAVGRMITMEEMVRTDGPKRAGACVGLLKLAKYFRQENRHSSQNVAIKLRS